MGVSPVDGNWYLANSTMETSSPHGPSKGHFSVSLRLPKSITQWKLQQQLQQQVEENPELADLTAEIKDKGTPHARHALQDSAGQSQNQQELQEQLQMLANSAGNPAGLQGTVSQAVEADRSAKQVSSDSSAAMAKHQKRQLQRYKSADMTSWHGSMM